MRQSKQQELSSSSSSCIIRIQIRIILLLICISGIVFIFITWFTENYFEKFNADESIIVSIQNSQINEINIPISSKIEERKEIFTSNNNNIQSESWKGTRHSFLVGKLGGYSKSEHYIKNAQIDNTSIRDYYLQGRWFQNGTKYFIYQPSGGLSNQRIELENALLVAKMIGRTLIIPPMGPHTSMYWNYNKIPWSRMVGAYDIFEDTRMSSIVPTLSLNDTTLMEFVQANRKHSFLKWQTIIRSNDPTIQSPQWTAQTLSAQFGTSSADILFFAKSSMWKAFDFSIQARQYAQLYVRLAEPFRTTARLIVDDIFGARPFHSMHIRFPDAGSGGPNDKYHADTLGTPESFLKRLDHANGTNETKRIYIATHPGKYQMPYFDAFRKAGYDLVFGDRLIESPAAQTLLSRFPQNDMQITLLGLVEQLVCARARVFVGSAFSTFSRYIGIKRSEPLLVIDGSLLDDYREHTDTKEYIVQQLQDAIDHEESTNTTRYQLLQNELWIMTRTLDCRSPGKMLAAC